MDSGRWIKDVRRPLLFVAATLRSCHVGPSGLVVSQPLDETDIIVVFGTSHDDRITIAPDTAELLMGIPRELHGHGGYDTLVVNGTAASDIIEVMPTEIQINEDLSLCYGNFEAVDIQALGGEAVHRPSS